MSSRVASLTSFRSGIAVVDRFQDHVLAVLNPILKKVSGDLSGPLQAPTVAKLQGRAVAPTAPTDTQALAWNKAKAQWEPQTVPGGSLSGTVPIASGGTGATTATGAVTNLGAVPTTRLVSAGTGLSGGGDLSADRTLSLPNVGTAGTYGDATHVPQLTTDAQGRVSSVSSVAITAGGPQRPALVGDELLVYRCNDAGPGLANTGSVSSANLTQNTTAPLSYSVPGPWATGVLPTLSNDDLTQPGASGAAAVTIPDTFSASCWFVPYLSSTTNRNYAFGKSDTSDYTFALGFGSSAQSGAIFARISTSGSAGHDITAPGAWSVVAGRLYFVVLTYTTGALKLYVDGELVASDATAGTVTNDGTKAVWIGAGTIAAGFDEGFPGKIFEARVNPSVLSQATIRQQFATGMGWQA